MITVCLNKAEFEYDIHSLVKAFYAREDVKVFADREKITKLEQGNTPLFHMEILFRGEGTVEIALYLPPKGQGAMGQEGIAYGDGGYKLEVQRLVETDFTDRKATKNKLKQALYQMLTGYTDRTLPWGALTGIRPVKIPMSMLEQGIGEDKVRDYMAGTYFATGQKISLSIEIAKRELEVLQGIDYKQGYSLYVGIPFCPSICSYCSFSSSPIGMWEGKTDSYLDALDKELAYTASSFSHKKLNTIYIGGGTPTTLSASQLDRLLSGIARRFSFADLLEYTVEAGRPDSITREKLNVLREHGISRISINPQTMKQETLDLIGRRHTVGQAVESFWLARELGFDNINMDLILGLPGETLEDVRGTMEQVKRLSPDNLTVHSLAIKRAARLKMFAEDYEGMAIENSWDMVDLTAAYARELGLSPYYLYRQKNMAGNFENVGYARQGKAGLYNILMMEEKQDIVALGAGSISKRVYPSGQIERVENVKDVALYIGKIEEMIGRKRKLFI